ncbi:Diamine acetyltransferase [Granulibacter bethesdensis]|uniref:GNAT family N-acetyltransferase n=1 Tax=Granulibacter bethesdensis TaxID=364410 RepID=UPI00090C07A7|nr:GNAT family N-acetyltransferase [Granulibacter bethesdensis]APH56993.1 Diamine acetyltransferase [Granulibacter bethesdensis]
MSRVILTKERFLIREANRGDVQHLVRFIRDLAAFEQLSHEAVATEEDFEQAFFGAFPRVFALLACVEGKPVGVAVWYYTFSTFTGRHGIYLEDLYVDPPFRRRGIAQGFFTSLARIAVQEGLRRFEWAVLDWNEDAITFYRRMGAVGMEEWTVQRVTGEALERLAED